MDPTPDLERLQDALEELLAVTTEGRAADLLRALIGAIILEGSDTVLTALVEMATHVAPDGMATVVVARDMAPKAESLAGYGHLDMAGKWVQEYTAPSTFRFEVMDHTGAAVTCSAEGCTKQATQFSYHNGTHAWCADHSPFQFKYSASLG